MRGERQDSGYAGQLQCLLREHLGHDQVVVGTHGDHLVIEVLADWGKVRIARLTPIGGRRFGLAFRSHMGRWVSLPYTGTLEEKARVTAEQLGGHLRSENYAGWQGTEPREF